jgi:hypothetical protein
MQGLFEFYAVRYSDREQMQAQGGESSADRKMVRILFEVSLHVHLKIFKTFNVL